MRFVLCVWSWRSLDVFHRHLPFDDGFCLPFGIPSQKGGVHCRVLFSGREYFVGWSLWSLDCILVLHIVFYLFSSCHVFDGLFMLGGVFFFFYFYLFIFFLSF